MPFFNKNYINKIARYKTAIDFTICPNAKTNAIYELRHSADVEAKCCKIVRHLIDRVISVE